MAYKIVLDLVVSCLSAIEVNSLHHKINTVTVAYRVITMIFPIKFRKYITTLTAKYSYS